MHHMSKAFELVLNNLVPVYDAGSPDYWLDLAEGHRRIRNVFASLERVRSAPVISPDDDESSISKSMILIREAHDAFFIACYAVDRHPTALRILANSKISTVGGYRFID